MKKKGLAIFLCANDFRLRDNEALTEASSYEECLPLFLYKKSSKALGGASRSWLHYSLKTFQETLGKENSKLLILEGDFLESLRFLLSSVSVASVFWNENYNPLKKKFFEQLKVFLEEKKIPYSSCHGYLLSKPEELLKKDGTPYLVYTAFWKNFVRKYKPKTLEKVKLSPYPKDLKIKSHSVESLELLPSISWDKEFYKMGKPGEENALRALQGFLKKSAEAYQEKRDIPSLFGTSRLSPYLHFGEIHPQRVLQSLESEFGSLVKTSSQGVLQFAKEVVWREFSHHLLWHFPFMVNKPLRSAFENFPWKKNKKLLRLWQKGLTGYPIVDAGMRELWETGWMHNRVRMVVASFLVKNLGIPWQEGALWFHDTLLDASLANNTASWQWVAGCGADAAPFFRIFSPKTQGEKFDPEGVYVKKWCPELAKLPKKWIHAPSEAPEAILQAAGITLGKNYPKPIVNYKESREKALQNYDWMKKF